MAHTTLLEISSRGSYCCDCRFLREEQLEMQVWVSYGSRKGDEQRPKHRDKLIGSAYISLEPLSDERRKQHRVRYGIILRPKKICVFQVT